MSRRITCASLLCDNASDSNPDLIFHPFPDDEKRCKQWILQCRRQDLLNEETSYLHNNFWLCCEHFDSSAYLQPRKALGFSTVQTHGLPLLRSGIPTIFFDTLVKKSNPLQQEQGSQKMYEAKKKQKTSPQSSPRLVIKEEEPLQMDEQTNLKPPFFAENFVDVNALVKEEPEDCTLSESSSLTLGEVSTVEESKITFSNVLYSCPEISETQSQPSVETPRKQITEKILEELRKQLSRYEKLEEAYNSSQKEIFRLEGKLAHEDLIKRNWSEALAQFDVKMQDLENPVHLFDRMLLKRQFLETILKHRGEEKSEDLISANAKNMLLEARTKLLESQISTLEKDRSDLQKTITQLNAKIREDRGEKISKHLIAANAKNVLLEARTKVLESENTSLERGLSNLQEIMARLGAEIQEVSTWATPRSSHEPKSKMRKTFLSPIDTNTLSDFSKALQDPKVGPMVSSLKPENASTFINQQKEKILDCNERLEKITSFTNNDKDEEKENETTPCDITSEDCIILDSLLENHNLDPNISNETTESSIITADIPSPHDPGESESESVLKSETLAQSQSQKLSSNIVRSEEFTPKNVSQIAPQSSSPSEDFSRSYVSQIVPQSRSTPQSDVLAQKIDENTHNVRNTAKRVHNELFTYLNSCSDGKAILNYYNKHSILNEATRKRLTDIIIRSSLKNDSTMILTNSDYEKLSKQICEVFPTELKEIYFIPFKVIRGIKMRAKGKLVNKLHNLRKTYKADGLKIKPDAKLIPEVTYDTGNISGAQYRSEIDWLSITPTDLKTAAVKWKITAPRRLKEFKASGEIDVYLKKFPLLCMPEEAHDFISIDFADLYPGHENCLFNLWPTLRSNILTLATERYEEEVFFAAEINESGIEFSIEDDEDKNLSAIYLLLYLLPILNFSVKKRKQSDKSSGEEPGKNNYQVIRPSRTELIKRILFTVKSTGTMTTEVETHIEECKKKGDEFVQPFVVVVESNPKPGSFVYFRGIFYAPKNIIEALDLCFKLHLVFNVKYADGALTIWTLIQKFVFRINTPDDKNYSSICTLANDLRIY